MSVQKYFTEENKLQIASAIRVAETNTSGEIRVHIEKHCHEDVLDRAAYWFEQLDPFFFLNSGDLSASIQLMRLINTSYQATEKRQ